MSLCDLGQLNVCIQRGPCVWADSFVYTLTAQALSDDVTDGRGLPGHGQGSALWENRAVDQGLVMTLVVTCFMDAGTTANLASFEHVFVL